MSPACNVCGRMVCAVRGEGVIGCKEFIPYDEGRLLGQYETRDRLVYMRFHGRRCD